LVPDARCVILVGLNNFTVLQMICGPLIINP
jgi:hypothetical protein